MAKTEKVTAKSVIVAGIEGGKSVKFILAQIAKKIPDSKADENHVKHYAGILTREGKLDAETAATKYNYRPRGAALKGTTKKAKAESTEDAPAPAKKTARRKKPEAEPAEKPAAKTSRRKKPAAKAAEKPAAKKPTRSKTTRKKA